MLHAKFQDDRTLGSGEVFTIFEQSGHHGHQGPEPVIHTFVPTSQGGSP